MAHLSMFGMVACFYASQCFNIITMYERKERKRIEKIPERTWTPHHHAADDLFKVLNIKHGTKEFLRKVEKVPHAREPTRCEIHVK